MAPRPATPPNLDPEEDADFRFKTNGTACEWGESYHPGGYHPVHLGDILLDRFVVLRKLGYGEYSTAWLALDQERSLFVALKIGTANLTQDAIDREASLYSSLRPTNCQHVVRLENVLNILGPNGKHPCFVLELLGPSINFLLRKHPTFRIGEPWQRRFPKKLARQMLRDILLGLASLHGCGIVHGDLHPGNILICIPQIEANNASEKSLLQAASDEIPLIRRDGAKDLWAPSYLLEPAPLIDYVDLGHEPLVKVTDLGAAFFESDPLTNPFTPVALRAPETILGLGIGRGIDIWCVGCLAFELITGRQLFVRLESLQGDEDDETTNDEHLIQLGEVLGPMPQDLFSQWRRGSKYYGPDGKLLVIDNDSEMDSDEGNDHLSNGSAGSLAHDSQDKPATSPLASPESFPSLEQQVKKGKPDDMDEGEEAVFLGLLRWTFEYDPQKRPTAIEILEHPWFN